MKVRQLIISRAMTKDIGMPLRRNDRHQPLNTSLANLIRKLPADSQLWSSLPTPGQAKLLEGHKGRQGG
jgi:hypothetical protein